MHDNIHVTWCMHSACWIARARIQTHTHCLIFIAFNGSNGYARAPLCYVIHTLPVSYHVVLPGHRDKASPKNQPLTDLQKNNLTYLISNLCHVLNVVCFLLGNSPASEFYTPTFRNTLFHLHGRIGMKND